MILYIIRILALFIGYLVLLSLYVYLGLKTWQYLSKEKKREENGNDGKRSG